MKGISKKSVWRKLSNVFKGGGVLMSAKSSRRGRNYRNAKLNNRMGKRRGMSWKSGVYH